MEKGIGLLTSCHRYETVLQTFLMIEGKICNINPYHNSGNLHPPGKLFVLPQMRNQIWWLSRTTPLDAGGGDGDDFGNWKSLEIRIHTQQKSQKTENMMTFYNNLLISKSP